jgi:hypothetical protein
MLHTRPGAHGCACVSAAVLCLCVALLVDRLQLLHKPLSGLSLAARHAPAAPCSRTRACASRVATAASGPWAMRPQLTSPRLVLGRDALSLNSHTDVGVAACTTALPCGARAVSCAASLPQALDYADALFEQADTNKDGKVREEENPAEGCKQQRSLADSAKGLTAAGLSSDKLARAPLPVPFPACRSDPLHRTTPQLSLEELREMLNAASKEFSHLEEHARFLDR